MICSKCGAGVADGTNFCGFCGAAVQSRPTQFEQPQDPYSSTQPGYSQPGFTYQQPYAAEPIPPAYYDPTTPYNHKASEGLFLAAFVLNVISTVVGATLIIPLAWMIPMTVHSYGIYKGTKPNTTGFGVWTLLVLNLISGILYLVADKDR